MIDFSIINNLITRLYLRFVNALCGLLFAILHDGSYQMQVISGILVLTVFTYYFSPFTQTEVLFLGLSWTLVLITELQNSSFEEALDRLHPELHDSIKNSKDMAAGSVLTAGLFMLFVMVTIALY